MKHVKKIVFLAAFSAVLWACDTKDNKKYLPESVGAINSMAIIIDNELWNGRVGDELRKHFAAPVDGLPWEEPLFSIQQMPESVFSDFARNSRNILIVGKDTTAYEVKNDLYAEPQKTTFMKASDDQNLIQLIQDRAPELIAMYKKHDIEENQRRIQMSVSKETKLKEKFGISLTMSSIYETVKEEDNFIWMERKISKGTMNIIAYELPLNAIPKDSTRVEAIIKMRDSIGEKYVPGREEGTYMITEKAYAPYVFDAEIAGRKAIETKGMWEVKGFFMAGPFLNYIVRDEANNRLLVLEGFTFAPSTNKRNFMFELEAILKSLKIG